MLIPFSDLWKKYKIDATGVLHVGASTGQECAEYYKNGIQRSIWIEALNPVCKKLKQHVSKYPNATVLEACIGETSGETVQFNVANNEGQSSSYLEFGTHSKEHPTVKFIDKIEMVTVRLDKLLQYGGFDLKDYTFLNIDLQGAELFALKSLGSELHKVKFLYCEVNSAPLYVNCPMIEDIDEYVAKFGLVPVETCMTNFKWGDRFYAKK